MAQKWLASTITGLPVLVIIMQYLFSYAFRDKLDVLVPHIDLS